MAKIYFPKELQIEPLSINLDWLNDYAKDIKKAKYQKLLIFFKYKGHASKPFNEFTIEDIKAFTDKQYEIGYSSDAIRTGISALSSYKDVLIEKYPAFFNSQFLKNINDLKKLYGESADAGKALNLIQLALIRQFLSKDKNQKIRFVFELLFQLGIQEKDIQFCAPKYLVKYADKWVFLRPNGTEIILNDYIKEMVMEYEGTGYMEKNMTMINDYFIDITNYLKENKCYSYERNINFYDIRATRKHFFITCPNCKRELETYAENWVLAKTSGIDKDYHLVCKVCKGEPQHEN